MGSFRSAKKQKKIKKNVINLSREKVITMNRAERRKALKSINTPKKFTDTLSEALDFQRRDMEKQFEQQRKDMVDVVLTMTAYTIQYKLGLGKKRLPEIMGYILDNIDAFNTGHLTKEDFKTIKEDLKKYNFYIE